MQRERLLGWVALAAVFGFGKMAALPETRVRESDVPTAAIEAVKRKYPNARIEAFTRERDKSQVEYEVTLRDGGRKLDVSLSPEGTILSEEEVISEKELPQEVRKALKASVYGKARIAGVERLITREKNDEPTYEIHVLEDGKKHELVFDKTGKPVKG